MFGLGAKAKLPRLTELRATGFQLLQEHLNPIGKTVFDMAFPAFDPPPWTEEEKRKATGRLGAHHVFLMEDQHRRFGGIDLSRGCYYSLSNENGTDPATLCGELNAYRGTRESDASYAEAFSGSEVSAEMLTNGGVAANMVAAKDDLVFVGVMPGSALKNAMVERGFDLPEGAHDTLSDESCAWVLLKPKKHHLVVPDVVDLRQPETRESFFKAFAKGAKPAEGENAYWRPAGGNIKSFDEMLPELIEPNIGGASDGAGGSTQGIGQYLRTQGVSGVVFPSARTESAVEVEDGRLARFWGWNFVDYRTSKRDVLGGASLSSVNVAPWSMESLSGVKIDRSHTGRYKGSLRIEGLSAANRALVESRMNAKQLEVKSKAESMMSLIVVLTGTH